MIDYAFALSIIREINLPKLIAWTAAVCVLAALFMSMEP